MSLIPNPSTDPQKSGSTSTSTKSGSTSKKSSGSSGGGGGGGGGGAKSGTPQWFARQVLRGLGMPITNANVQWLVAWESREGGHWENSARYNPLNTTLAMSGDAGTMNGVGVRVYSSWKQGIAATVQTLRAGRYSDIRNALSSGHVSLDQHFQSLMAWSGNGYDNVAGGNIHYTGGSGGGGGFSGGGGAAGAAGNNQFSKGDVKSAFGNFGIPTALINSDPTLKAAFDKIVSKRIDDPTRIRSIIEATKWWRSRSSAQRKFDEMSVDPARRMELQAELHQKQADIHMAAQQMGLALNQDTLGHLAHMSLRNAFDDTQMRQALATHFQYANGDSYAGEAGVDVTGLKQLASDYWIGMGDNRIQNMVQRMLSGGLDPNAVKDYFIQHAEQRFSYLKPQLNQGMTVGDIAAPYVNAMGNILELSPTAIKPGDQTILKALQQPDGQGGFQLMPEWQFQNTLRNDPRWLATQNAHQTLLGLGSDLLKSFGLVA